MNGRLKIHQLLILVLFLMTCAASAEHSEERGHSEQLADGLELIEKRYPQLVKLQDILVRFYQETDFYEKVQIQGELKGEIALLRELQNTSLARAMRSQYFPSGDLTPSAQAELTLVSVAYKLTDKELEHLGAEMDRRKKAAGGAGLSDAAAWSITILPTLVGWKDGTYGRIIQAKAETKAFQLALADWAEKDFQKEIGLLKGELINSAKNRFGESSVELKRASYYTARIDGEIAGASEKNSACLSAIVRLSSALRQQASALSPTYTSSGGKLLSQGKSQIEYAYTTLNDSTAFPLSDQ